MSLPITNPYSIHLGVVGAGTMGSGIALTALAANLFVTLYDVSPEMLETARRYIENHLERKGKSSAGKKLTLTSRLEDLHGAGIVIEAAPESLAIKQELFARLDAICPPPAVLATNTSTLPVTAIAAATSSSQRVAGMHFFNPAPVLPLVEVVRGAQTGGDTIQALVSLAELLGKTPVVASDTPGFIVNRVARPFYGEALRLVGEGAASVEQVDQIVRLGGKFRMGPFELMDLIGIDINFAATQSMYEQTFGEPRYRPHPLQARMVQQNKLGRKTGQGFYHYDREPVEPEPPPKPRQATGIIGTTSAAPAIALAGNGVPGLGDLLRSSGYRLTDRKSPEVIAALAAGSRREGLERQVARLESELPYDTLLLCQCDTVTLTEIATWLDHPERLVGFDGMFLGNGPVATLVPAPTLTPQSQAAATAFFRNLGKLPVWIQDSPGLVLPRIVGMLVNEAAFAVGEGVAEPAVIDTAMRLGVNYPEGPLAWGKKIGYANILDILDHLHSEFGEDRYRSAPLLRRWTRLGRISG